MTPYYFLDILGTVGEEIVFCVIAVSFRLMPENKIRRYLPFVLHGILLYLMTWMTEINEYKGIAGTIIMALIISICYKISFLKAAISAMCGIILVLLSEAFGCIIIIIVGMPMTEVVGEQVLVFWGGYLVIFACRIATALGVHAIFRNFHYQFTWKDFLYVFFQFCLSQILWVFYYGDFFNGQKIYFNILLELSCIVLSVGLLIPLFYFKNYYIIQGKAKQDALMLEQLQDQYEYYHDKQQEEQRIRSVYHDLKNHLLILQSQAEMDSEINNSIQNLEKQISEYENYYHTGNEFLDIIVRDKARAAREKQIDFVAAIHFEDGSFMEPLDISTIFGNALDNAIEASEKLPADRRMITIKVSRIRDMLIVTIENNAVTGIPGAGKTTKKDDFLHGFGLDNIKKAVEKYDGESSVKAQDGLFTLKIMIPIP